MPAFKKAPKKDKYADLPKEFAEKIESGSDQEITNEIAKSAMAEVQNRLMKGEDLDLQEKVAQAKEAGAVYREASKMNSLKISYARSVLEARGRDVGQG